MQYELAYSTFGPEERDAITAVMDSDRFTMGEKVRNFEKEFSQYFGMKHGVMVNSGSSANLVAVAALIHHSRFDLKPGDEVIVPCISWATTYYPLMQYGLKLVFVDADLETLNYDIDQLKQSISPKTKMIVAVSILGNPCYFDAIEKICDENGLLLFEDNCESMAAKYKGKYTGTRGVVNTYSSFFSHHISTGEGGVVLTDDDETYHLLLSLRNHGWTRDQPSDSKIFQREGSDFFEAYRFILPGYNVRPSEINGAVGSVQLKKLDQFTKIRRQNAEIFQHYFANDDRFIIQKEVEESSWFAFTMILRPELSIERSEVLEVLKAKEIGHRIITGGNFLRHDVHKFADFRTMGSKNADIAHDRGFFVGNGPVDIEKEIKLLHETLKQIKVSASIPTTHPRNKPSQSNAEQ